MSIPSEDCPFRECDGTGLIDVYDHLEKRHFARVCRCEHLRKVSRLLSFAEIPEEFRSLTINSFQIDLYTTEDAKAKAGHARTAAANFVRNFEKFKEIGKGLYLYSFTKGSGKTRLAASIANALVQVHQANVKFTTTIQLLDTIKGSFDKDSKIKTLELLDVIKSVDVLVLDDFGTERPTEWVNEKFYDILNERMAQKRITIFTSNTEIENLKHDERIVNRIEKMAVPLYLPDESIRRHLAKNENEELQDLLFG